MFLGIGEVFIADLLPCPELVLCIQLKKVKFVGGDL